MGMNISEIARGALVERAEGEIDKIIQNIADPNTSLKKKRKLTIELVFVPTERDSAMIEIHTKSAIAPYEAVTTQVYIGQDTEGKATAQEYIRGQMVGQYAVDVDSGEIVDEVNTRKEKKIQGIAR